MLDCPGCDGLVNISIYGGNCPFCDLGYSAEEVNYNRYEEDTYLQVRWENERYGVGERNLS